MAVTKNLAVKLSWADSRNPSSDPEQVRAGCDVKTAVVVIAKGHVGGTDTRLWFTGRLWKMKTSDGFAFR